jgi:hypothetical protein
MNPRQSPPNIQGHVAAVAAAVAMLKNTRFAILRLLILRLLILRRLLLLLLHFVKC